MSSSQMVRLGASPGDTRNGAANAAGRRGQASLLVLCADELVLIGCRFVFAREPWVGRCLLARTMDRGKALAAEHQPSAALAYLGSNDAAAAIVREMRAAHESMRILLVAESSRLTEGDARAAGAAGLITPSLGITRLRELVRAAAMGGSPAAFESEATRPVGAMLSARERQVLGHLATGATNREISERLVLAPDTIKNHVSRTFRKLGAHNRLEAVNRARDLGLLS